MQPVTMCSDHISVWLHVGPNEAGADFLKRKVERMLEKMDAVIYLLDYTKIGKSWTTCKRCQERSPVCLALFVLRLGMVC